MQKRMYAIARHDLRTKGYKAAQCGHALAQYMIEHKPQETGDWENNHLIFLETKTNHCLDKIIYKLERDGCKFSKFYEPDLDGQLTAIAGLNIGHILSKYNIL